MKAGTVSLCVISKDYDDNIIRIIKDYSGYFNQVLVQLNGKGVKLPRDVGNVTFSKHKWDDDFGKARNALLNQVTTDYWLWMDTDDLVEGLDQLPSLIAEMEREQIDVIDFLYEYAYNDQGECITRQWRERLIRNRKDLYWRGRVHETVLSETPVFRVKRDEIVYKHSKTADEHEASAARNHSLLLREWDETKDPRTAHYLGLSFYVRKDWEQAIDLFVEHVKTSGWPEEQYRSWLYIAQSWKFLGNLPKAQRALNEAMDILPDFPDAYLFKGAFYLEEGEFAKALSWIEAGRNKPLPEDTLAAIDMTLYTYKPLIDGALALLNLGRIKEAYAWFAAAKKLSPNNENIKKFSGLFEETYGETVAIERAKWLMSYAAAVGGRPLEILKALTPELANSVKFNPDRAKYLPKTTWGKNSIVFFSGVAPEPWGPDFLHKGMGGSEEAIVYLSSELAKLGWDVTVFCDRETELEHEGVHWKPWTLLNPYDKFNIFVAWRNPFLAHGVKAKTILCDVHDVIPPAQVENSTDFVDKYMVKTNYHRSLFLDVADNKFAVVGNGIRKSQFSPAKKRPHSVGYFSSYNRGLECLLEMWPEIRKQVPDATLDIYYGFDVFDKVATPQMRQWKAKMLMSMKRLASQGVMEHGRVSHEELAARMEEIAVWAYPVSFHEIFCITATKALMAGCIPVTTGVAALKETQGGFGYTIESDKIEDDPAKQNEFIQAVVAALKQKDYDTAKQKQFAESYDWSNIAKEWDEILRAN